jgi:WD40 repeat protein
MLGFGEAENEEDLRGFEWFYLNRLGRANQTWGRHRGPVSLGKVTDDGRWAVSVGGRELRVWDARSGTVAAEWQHTADLSEIAAVSSDGRYAAAVPLRRDHGVLVFTRGDANPRTLEQSLSYTLQIEFTSKNRLLSLSDGVVHEFDVSAGQFLRKMLDGYTTYSFDVYREGQSFIAAIYHSEENRIFHPIAAFDLLSNQLTQRGTINADMKELAVSIDGRFLVYKDGVKGQISVWDVVGKAERSQFTFPNDGTVKLVGRLADGRLAAATWPDGVSGKREVMLAVWDPRTDRWESMTVKPPCQVHDARFLPDGRGLLIGGMDSRVIRMELPPPERETGWPVSMPFEAWALAISPDGQTIVTGGDDHVVRLWHARTGARLAELKDHGSLVTKAVYAPSGKWFATSSFDGHVIIRDPQSGTPQKNLVHGDKIRALAVSSDGRSIAAAGDTGLVSVWDVESGAIISSLNGKATVIHCLTFTPDGRELHAPLNETELVWWDVSKGSQLRESNLWLRPSCMALSPDGKTLAVGYETGQIVFLNATDGRELRRASGPYSRLNSLAFAPDGKTLAAASVDGCVRLWQTGTATELFAIQREGPQINEVIFSPDGAYLAATRHDGKLLIWRTK